MKKLDTTTNVKRRAFLKGAAVSTVAVSGAGLAGNAVASPSGDDKEKTQKGYQLTPHVRHYYRLARF